MLCPTWLVLMLICEVENFHPIPNNSIKNIIFSARTSLNIHHIKYVRHNSNWRLRHKLIGVDKKENIPMHWPSCSYSRTHLDGRMFIIYSIWQRYIIYCWWQTYQYKLRLVAIRMSVWAFCSITRSISTTKKFMKFNETDYSKKK